MAAPTRSGDANLDRALSLGTDFQYHLRDPFGYHARQRARSAHRRTSRRRLESRSSIEWTRRPDDVPHGLERLRPPGGVSLRCRRTSSCSTPPVSRRADCCATSITTTRRSFSICRTRSSRGEQTRRQLRDRHEGRLWLDSRLRTNVSAFSTDWREHARNDVCRNRLVGPVRRRRLRRIQCAVCRALRPQQHVRGQLFPEPVERWRGRSRKPRGSNSS